MHTLTDEDLQRAPQQLLADARRGQITLVTTDGRPMMLAVPLPDNPDARRIGQALDQGRLVACPTPLQTLRGWAPASRLPSCTPKPSALRCCLTNGPGVSLRWTWA